MNWDFTHSVFDAMHMVAILDFYLNFNASLYKIFSWRYEKKCLSIVHIEVAIFSEIICRELIN